MRNLARFVRGACISTLAVVVVCFALLVTPALAAGPRLGTPNQKTLIETDHFGTFYLPKVVVAGRSVIATWRGPNQNGTVRTIAVSKDGGATFTYKLKPVRIPGLDQILDVAGDAAGNIYFAGTTVIQSQLVVVRTDAKFKTFSAPTILDLDRNVVGIALRIASDGRLFLAYQTSFSVRLRNNVTGTADQIMWGVSSDLGATFTSFAPTNAKPTEVSDSGPTLVTGPNGEVYLLSLRDDTYLRAPAPDAYSGGALAVTRLDQDAEPVSVAVTRPSAGTGRLSQTAGYVAGDGTLGIAWADVTLGSDPRVQTVRIMRVDPSTGAPLSAPIELGSVGSSGDFNLARTSDGHVVALLIGAGFDSGEREPAVIGRASTDDGASFGPIRQVTKYPSVTDLDVYSDGRKVYGLWTDTRMVRFSGFSAKASN